MVIDFEHARFFKQQFFFTRNYNKEEVKRRVIGSLNIQA